MNQKIKNLGIENNPEQKKVCRKLFQTTYSQSNPTKPQIKCLGGGMIVLHHVQKILGTTPGTNIQNHTKN